LILSSWSKLYFREDHFKGGRSSVIQQPWVEILKSIWNYKGYSLETFNTDFNKIIGLVRSTISATPFNEVFDFIQLILRHAKCPSSVKVTVAHALELSNAAYILVEGDTIFPAASEQDAVSIETALHIAKRSGVEGARTHLKNASICSLSRDVAGCLRESVQAAEAAATVVSGEATFGAALTTLLKRDIVDERVKKSIEAIYNMSNQEPGARHSLKRQGVIDLEMEESMFALSTCAAFVSYVLTRGLRSGLVKETN